MSFNLLDEMLYEVALQRPILQGDIAIDIHEEDRFICIPKEVVDATYCRTHKKFRYNCGIVLSAFHRYPSVISWRVGRKYASENSIDKQYSGITFNFYCSNSKDNCVAEKLWKSKGLESHNNEMHVIFEETFKPFELKEEIKLNRHIHPQGQLHNSNGSTL